MLAGQRPFTGTSDLEVLQQIIHAGPQPFPGDVPAGLRAVVVKALDKKPADRYQSMKDMTICGASRAAMTRRLRSTKPRAGGLGLSLRRPSR